MAQLATMFRSVGERLGQRTLYCFVNSLAAVLVAGTACAPPSVIARYDERSTHQVGFSATIGENVIWLAR